MQHASNVDTHHTVPSVSNDALLTLEKPKDRTNQWSYLRYNPEWSWHDSAIY